MLICLNRIDNNNITNSTSITKETLIRLKALIFQLARVPQKRLLFRPKKDNRIKYSTNADSMSLNTRPGHSTLRRKK